MHQLINFVYLLPVKLLFVINSLDVLEGGPPRVLAELTSQLTQRGHFITVVSRPHKGESVTLHPAVNCLYLTPKITRFWSLFPQVRLLSSFISDADAVIVSGVWGILEGLLLSLASWSYTPVYIRACGMLEPYILSRRPLLKLIARILYVNRNITRSAGLIVNTLFEKRSISTLGFPCFLHVIPNGCRLPKLSEQLSRSESLSILNLDFTHEQKVILFLARLHPKKGLHNLLLALSMNPILGDNWQLVVAGSRFPSERYQRRIKNICENPSISHSVHFIGEVYGLRKIAALSLANLFVLPSESEGFPNAVLEAMAWSTPVLISPGCNFPNVEAESAGWIVNPSPLDISKKLSYAISDSKELQVRGMRARSLVGESFTMDKVVDLYEELLFSSFRSM